MPPPPKYPAISVEEARVQIANLKRDADKSHSDSLALGIPSDYSKHYNYLHKIYYRQLDMALAREEKAAAKKLKQPKLITSAKKDKV